MEEKLRVISNHQKETAEIYSSQLQDFYVNPEMFIKYEHEKTNENISLSTMLNDIKSGFTYFVSVKPIFILMMGILVLNFFFLIYFY